jgi:hypothetical protein
MIKMRSDNTLIFGLSDMNMKKLKEGKPIKFNLKDLKVTGMDPDKLKIAIFNGRTEESMTNQMLDLFGKNIGKKK